MAALVKVDQNDPAAEPAESYHEMSLRRQREQNALNELRRKDRDEEVAIKTKELEVKKKELDLQIREQDMKSTASKRKLETLEQYYEMHNKFKADDESVHEYGPIESEMAFQCRKEIENA